jgi:hypothetical protein
LSKFNLIYHEEIRDRHLALYPESDILYHNRVA